MKSCFTCGKSKYYEDGSSTLLTFHSYLFLIRHYMFSRSFFSQTTTNLEFLMFPRPTTLQFFLNNQTMLIFGIVNIPSWDSIAVNFQVLQKKSFHWSDIPYPSSNPYIIFCQFDHIIFFNWLTFSSIQNNTHTCKIWFVFYS